MATRFPEDEMIQFFNNKRENTQNTAKTAKRSLLTADRLSDIKVAPVPKIPEYDTFQHLTNVGNRGGGPGEFRCPQCVFIQESTGHIFVTDSDCAQVQIFSESGKFLDYFVYKKLNAPMGILVHGNHVYVTDGILNSIFLFELPTNRKRTIAKLQVGERGSDYNQFNSPEQMAISPNQLLYVADSWNNRLQILDLNLGFQDTFEHETMTCPVDVKFSSNKLVVLSSTDSQCIHMFTHSGEKIRSIISNGVYGMHVCHPHYFCLDALNNIIIISDRSIKNIEILVFSPQGELLHTLRVASKVHGLLNRPKGVAILNHTKLVCAHSLYPFPIQIFSP